MAHTKQKFQITDEQLLEVIKNYLTENVATTRLIGVDNIFNLSINKLKYEIEMKRFALIKMLEFLHDLEYGINELNESKLQWNDCIKMQLHWCYMMDTLYAKFETNGNHLAQLKYLHHNICNNERNIEPGWDNLNRENLKQYHLQLLVGTNKNNPFRKSK